MPLRPEESYSLPWDLFYESSQFNLPLMLRRAEEERKMQAEKLRWTLYVGAQLTILVLGLYAIWHYGVR